MHQNANLLSTVKLHSEDTMQISVQILAKTFNNAPFSTIYILINSPITNVLPPILQLVQTASI